MEAGVETDAGYLFQGKDQHYYIVSLSRRGWKVYALELIAFSDSGWRVKTHPWPWRNLA